MSSSVTYDKLFCDAVLEENRRDRKRLPLEIPQALLQELFQRPRTLLTTRAQ
jgi:hypothetical protein